MADERRDPDQRASIPTPSAAFLLSVLGRQVRARVDAALQSEGIAVRHVSALGHLSRDPGLSYSELGRRAAVTPQSMQATLNKLEEIGAVEKVGGGGRGRSARLFVTPEGQRLISVGMASYDELDRALAEHLGQDALRALTPSLLRAFRAFADDSEDQ
ncbi:MarR family transcriptional regulator [Williamsia sp. 1138]|uniref:MarR family winged helix-turn-helix transcriptional regulator n=1 Tax=Williamsia sp. 1138 TaxID=1903117 RepID=UPI000A1155C9|nr:MarR family winged helix-turn-helix transcriptional regulator [Williamsia sp. 1138]OZG27797.1 MarR family transcriptional regulator [Williamsia sp. 1138]